MVITYNHQDSRTLMYCKSDYIAFCEGDDYWNDKRKLERQVAFLMENPDYGLVYTDYAQFNESTKSTINNYLATKRVFPISGFQPKNGCRRLSNYDVNGLYQVLTFRC